MTIGGSLEKQIFDEVEIVERHIHSSEKWFGMAATPSGETHVADRMVGGILPFTLTTGNDDFGAWTQVLGSSDTPVLVSAVFFDAHRFMVTSTNDVSAYIVQAVSGESAGIVAKLAAEQFTEIPYISSTNNADSGISDILSDREVTGTKIWVRAACIGQTTKTISFYYGIHEYTA